MLLEITDLAVAYGGIQALKGIGLEVAEHELVTLIGANGAGKSTTLRTISGLLRPVRGTLRYRGQPLEKLAPHQIVGLGIVHCPEGRRIFPNLTVAENLRMGAVQRRDPQGVAQDRAQVLDLFPVLGQRQTQLGATLSGGEQQMLAIGRALMSRPQLLLLDEPSLGLAPLMVERIFGVIRQLKASGTTMLLVEQNARQALEVADRAYVLEAGRVVLSGAAAELRHNPQVEQVYLGG